MQCQRELIQHAVLVMLESPCAQDLRMDDKDLLAAAHCGPASLITLQPLRVARFDPSPNMIVISCGVTHYSYLFLRIRRFWLIRWIPAVCVCKHA